MKLCKIICFGIIVLIILIFTYSMVRKKICFERDTINFTELIEDGNLEYVNLTIYYLTPTLLTFIPTSVESLKDELYEYRIVVSGRILWTHADLIEQMYATELVPVPIEEKSQIVARIYYRFENEKNGEIFTVAMWTFRETIHVNGVEVEDNPIFYDMIIPFLPYQEIEVMKNRAERLRSANIDNLEDDVL